MTPPIKKYPSGFYYRLLASFLISHKRNRSYKSLGELIEVNASTVWRTCTFRSLPDLATIAKYCSFLNISPNSIIVPDFIINEYDNSDYRRYLQEGERFNTYLFDHRKLIIDVNNKIVTDMISQREAAKQIKLPHRTLNKILGEKSQFNGISIQVDIYRFLLLLNWLKKEPIEYIY